MKESNILFKLSTSSKTGSKYSWRLNNGVGGDGGVVLAIDSLLCSSIAAVFVVAAGLDDDEAVIG
jgi:hypothetical protein